MIPERQYPVMQATIRKYDDFDSVSIGIRLTQEVAAVQSLRFSKLLCEQSVDKFVDYLFDLIKPEFKKVLREQYEQSLRDAGLPELSDGEEVSELEFCSDETGDGQAAGDSRSSGRD